MTSEYIAAGLGTMSISEVNIAFLDPPDIADIRNWSRDCADSTRSA